MAITRQTGFPKDASGTSLTTLAVTNIAVGDLLTVSGRILANNPVTNVTGGGANASGWSKVGDGWDGTTYVYLWACTIGATGAQTITVTFTNTGTANHIAADSWSSGLGTTTVWTAENLNRTQTTASSATVTYPSLTPLTNLSLYWGYGREASTFSAGSTTGFTYKVLTAVANVVATNPTVAAGTAYQPTYTQTTAGESMTVASIFAAALPAAAPSRPIMVSQAVQRAAVR